MITVHSAATDKDAPFVLWDSVLERGTMTVSGGDTAGGPNINGPQTYDDWEPTAANGYVQVILTAAETCDCVAIAGHNLADRAGYFRAYYSVDGVTAWTALASQYPVTNEPAAIAFAPISALGWRFYFNNPNFAIGPARINIAALGKRLVFPAPVVAPYVPARAADRVDAAGLVSMGGHFLGASAWRRGLEADVSFAPLPRSFTDGAEFRAFRDHYNAGGTFFWAADPTGLPADLAYYWRPEGSDDLRPVYRPGDYWAGLDMRLAGYAG